METLTEQIKKAPDQLLEVLKEGQVALCVGPSLERKEILTDGDNFSFDRANMRGTAKLNNGLVTRLTNSAIQKVFVFKTADRGIWYVLFKVTDTNEDSISWKTIGEPEIVGGRLEKENQKQEKIGRELDKIQLESEFYPHKPAIYYTSQKRDAGNFGTTGIASDSGTTRVAGSSFGSGLIHRKGT